MEPGRFHVHTLGDFSNFYLNISIFIHVLFSCVSSDFLGLKMYIHKLHMFSKNIFLRHIIFFLMYIFYVFIEFSNDSGFVFTLVTLKSRFSFNNSSSWRDLGAPVSILCSCMSHHSKEIEWLQESCWNLINCHDNVIFPKDCSCFQTSSCHFVSYLLVSHYEFRNNYLKNLTVWPTTADRHLVQRLRNIIWSVLGRVDT